MPDTYDVQQAAVSTMVAAMAVNVMSVAMGIAIAAMGPEALTTPAEERKGTKKALDDLKLTFGADIVNKADEAVGTDNIIALCKEIEKLYIEQMREKYGKYAADTALKAAPPGDLKTANEIAIALANRGYGKFDQTRAPAPVSVEAGAVATGTKKGRQKAKPQKDTKTGILYKSKAAAGMAVASEYGLDPSETFIWYSVIQKDPTRFVSVTKEAYEQYVAGHK